MHYTYILLLNNNKHYIGSTSNIKRRISEHNNKKCRSTKDNIPVKLIWCGLFQSKILAEDFEKYLKSSSGFSFRNKHLI